MKLKKAVKLGKFVLKHDTTRKIAVKIVEKKIEKKAKKFFKDR